jgi:transposase
MSEEHQRIKVITGQARQQRWSTEQKLRISRRIADLGKSVSFVLRRNGVVPNLLFRWRRVMNAGAVGAVRADEPRPNGQNYPANRRAPHRGFRP